MIGINGAGKSTTFKMLTGDVPISKGDVFVNGFNINTHMKEVLKLRNINIFNKFRYWAQEHWQSYLQDVYIYNDLILIQIITILSFCRGKHQGLLTYYVPMNKKLTVASMFSAIEAAKEKYAFSDYSISQTTIEQVFLSLSGYKQRVWNASRNNTKIFLKKKKIVSIHFPYCKSFFQPRIKFKSKQVDNFVWSISRSPQSKC